MPPLGRETGIAAADRELDVVSTRHETDQRVGAVGGCHCDHGAERLVGEWIRCRLDWEGRHALAGDRRVRLVRHGSGYAAVESQRGAYPSGVRARRNCHVLGGFLGWAISVTPRSVVASR